MLNLLIVFLSVVMFIDCILLVCLVLLQLPKKDAGAGLAFGASATDALFGAGSGNMLTKITKWVAGVFMGMALLMTILTAHNAAPSPGAALIKALGQGSAGSIQLPANGAPAAGLTAPASGPASTAPKAPPSGAAPQFLSIPTTNASSAPPATTAATNK